MMKVLFITGATATGKTDISIALAEELRGEIISSDSMQIYRGMDIGTAKASREVQLRVPHHLIDVCEPSDSFSVQQYRELAISAIEDISSRGLLPIVVGGTGLYIDALLRGPMSDAPGADPEYRDRLLSAIRTDEDRHALWERLRELDPESAEKTHENNVRRVIRALEIYEKTGKTKSFFDQRSRESSSDIDPLVVWLDMHSREELYRRIDLRVDKMMDEGLLSEVTALLRDGRLKPDTTASQAIGYKEIIGHLSGECSLSDAVEEIKLSSRRYAKRQLTWFRHLDAHHVYLDREAGEARARSEIIREIKEIINNKFK